MRIGIWTSNRDLAIKTLEEVEKTMKAITRQVVSRGEVFSQDAEGNIVKWIRPTESARGYRFDKMYVDVNVDLGIFYTVIMPRLLHGSFKDIIWIAGERTTVYEYLHALPQPLFEATLLGLMGFPLDPERDMWMHEWMERPCNEVFPKCSLADWKSGNILPINSMTMLGKVAAILPANKQEQLRNAMKNYCEVCDFVNDRLAEQQKASDIKGE